MNDVQQSDKGLKKQNERAQMAALNRYFYRDCWPEDIKALSPDDRKKITREFLSFFRQRTPKCSNIRVYSSETTSLEAPSKRKNKQVLSKVTVIEIVNDNMPFILDSIVSAINERGYIINLIFHPMIPVYRDSQGVLIRIGAEQKGLPQKSESVLHIEIQEISEEELNNLQTTLKKVLKQVRESTRDWKDMIARIDSLIDHYVTTPPPIDKEELDESIRFLEWLKDNNFTFLGLSEYKYKYSNDGTLGIRQSGSGLGILSDPSITPIQRAGQSIAMTPDIQEFLSQQKVIIVTKANVKSLVHRPVHLDYIAIKLFDPEGQVTGELRTVGLFTSTAYTRSVRKIPLIRPKVEQVIERSSFDLSGHSGKGLIDVLEHYPRDDMFQIDGDSLYKNATAILHLQERPRVRVIFRHDKFDRFVSVMTYVPKDRYDSQARQDIGNYLAQVFDGWIARFEPSFLPGTLVRVYFIIGRRSGALPVTKVDVLEKHIDQLTQSWSTRLASAMHDQGHDQHIARYHNAFSAAYSDNYDIQTALDDIAVIDQLNADTPMRIHLHTREDNSLTLRVYSYGKPIDLSSRLPILENMAFRVRNEHTHKIRPDGIDGIVYLHDLVIYSEAATHLKKSGTLLEETYLAVWHGHVDNDALNGLTLGAGISWCDILILRTIIRYLLQAGMSYDQSFIAATVNRFPLIASLLVHLFHARFDPKLAEEKRSKLAKTINKKIERALEKVSSFDDDRIIRRIQNVIDSILRTNFFQRSENDAPLEALVLKLDPQRIDDLPEPRPFREIFVYGPAVEGVHLRFGKVARGGLRWSDRTQDYRTEALGLVKAQQVKNAVIVPVGAKGCFLPKQLPVNGSREQITAEGIRAYKIFIGSMLDVTDNLKGGRNNAPPRTVCHDDPDPYLVVAADKGTASFSDTANAISIERAFWLGDAFASGGSVGYDHKKMGITARGAWESVKRHFREMDINIQKQAFTVIGVGDMSGDVFGNGMLLSPMIHLRAAFDHRDIFIDPNPDPKKSLSERRRLFTLKRSSWQDYNPQLISSGGGIFSRSSKSITISSTVSRMFGLGKNKVTPYELIVAILTTQTDLLWFGGIGTYIRATGESNNDVGDKANDAIRVTAQQLNCKVIGEGANLALTAQARIECSQANIRCYADAIDNSAGVNTSDLEVNIKIAMGAALQAGTLDPDQRNTQLAGMTKDVAALCLENNYRQGLAISLAHRHGTRDMADQEQLMLSLEQRGLLNRQVETLPSSAVMTERQQAATPLTPPEIGILLAYTKIVLFDDLLSTDLIDDPVMKTVLFNYFPQAMHDSFNNQITKHKLRREIIATMLANESINYGGITLISRLQQQTGVSPAQIIKSYVIVNEVYQCRTLFHQVDELDNAITGSFQLELYDSIQEFLVDRLLWFIQNVDMSSSIRDLIRRFAPHVTTLPQKIKHLMSKDRKCKMHDHIAHMTTHHVPEKLAHRIALLPVLSATAPITLVSESAQRDPLEVAHIYYQLANTLSISSLIDRIAKTNLDDLYDRRAVTESLITIRHALRSITLTISCIEQPVDKGIAIWKEQHASEVHQTCQTLDLIAREAHLSIAKIMVASSLLARLTSH